MRVTVGHLCAIAGGRAPFAMALVGPINRFADEYGIDTLTQLACWLGHMAHETAGFSRLEENLNYTSVERLRAVWPSRFKTDAAAKPYVGNPRGLANKVYGGRMGNKGPNDGWNYRGSGPMMTTGRDNFQQVALETGIDVVSRPDLLRDPVAGTQAAALYFIKHVRRVAYDDELSTKAINGGLIGLADRKAAIARARKVLPAALGPDLVKEAQATRPPGYLGGAPLVDYSLFKQGVRYEVVGRAQREARAKGYVGVGEVDHKWGSFTRNTLNAFRADNGIEPDMTGADIARTIALLEASARRTLPIERSAATVADLAPRSEIVQAQQAVGVKAKATQFVVGGAAAVSGVGTLAAQFFSSLSWLREFFGSLNPLWYLALVVTLAVVVHLMQNGARRDAKKTLDLRVDEYRNGGAA